MSATLEELTGYSTLVKPELPGLSLPPRRVILVSPPENNGWWTIECPALPGCISQGQTVEEALSNIKEAMELWLEDALESGQTIPAAGH
jgi:predicted RNase H-like HicB family nuclease